MIARLWRKLFPIRHRVEYTTRLAAHGQWQGDYVIITHAGTIKLISRKMDGQVVIQEVAHISLDR